MIRRDRTGERTIALFLLGLLMLLPPVLLIFNVPARVAGLPTLYVFIFSAWALLIALAALIARRIPSEPAPPSADVLGHTAEGDPLAGESDRA